MALSPEATKYQLAHIQDDRGPGFVVSVSIVVSLATVAVIGRLAARLVTKVGFGLDDYSIVVALLIAWGMFAGNILQPHFGLGKHLIASSPDALIAFGKLLFFEDLAYSSAIFVVQFSILALYHRVFTFQNRVFRACVFAVGTLSFLCWASIFFASAFACTPIQFNWDKSIPGGTCLNPNALFMAGLSLNLFTDICIVILPIPMIWRIQISKMDKVAVSGTFLLGSFICVGNLIRVPYLIGVQQDDITYSLVGGEIWGTAEACIAIVGACLPCFRPFLRVAKEAWSSVRSYRTSSSSRSRSRNHVEEINMGHSFVKPRHPWNPLPKDGVDYALENDIGYGGTAPESRDGLTRSAGGIGVKHEVFMTSSKLRSAV
ncbi:MAG: hypothetical protein M4579_005183 [Chaenotheca gracillima]|nr:MAG: hypothetical protein M4579_005183 [Chaenotheca gracillima]